MNQIQPFDPFDSPLAVFLCHLTFVWFFYLFLTPSFDLFNLHLLSSCLSSVPPSFFPLLNLSVYTSFNIKHLTFLRYCQLRFFIILFLPSPHYQDVHWWITHIPSVSDSPTVSQVSHVSDRNMKDIRKAVEAVRRAAPRYVTDWLRNGGGAS